MNVTLFSLWRNLAASWPHFTEYLATLLQSWRAPEGILRAHPKSLVGQVPHNSFLSGQSLQLVPSTGAQVLQGVLQIT
jgi:hypothetical protein